MENNEKKIKRLEQSVNEILKELNELKNPTDFKIGDWVYQFGTSWVYLLTKDWSFQYRCINSKYISKKNYRYATEDEILKRLTEEAERLGYKKGGKIKGLFNPSETITLEGDRFILLNFSDDKYLAISDGLINRTIYRFEDDKWAEIVKDPVIEFKESDWVVNLDTNEVHRVEKCNRGEYHNTDYGVMGMGINSKNFRLASDEEIVNKLKEVAEKMGYKEGVYIKPFPSYYNNKIKGNNYRIFGTEPNRHLVLDSEPMVAIYDFRTDMWAEIVKEEKFKPKVGDWVITTGTLAFLVVNNSAVQNGDYELEINNTRELKDLRLSTDDEILKTLIRASNQRKYRKGLEVESLVKCTNSMIIGEHHEITRGVKGNFLAMRYDYESSTAIYNLDTNIWAKIVEKPDHLFGYKVEYYPSNDVRDDWKIKIGCQVIDKKFIKELCELSKKAGDTISIGNRKENINEILKAIE